MPEPDVSADRSALAAQELSDAGLLDPGGDPRRARAVELLIERGATIDDLIEHRDDLGLLAARLVNGGRATMTRRQLAERVGVTLETLNRLWLAAGVAETGPDVLAATEDDVSLVEAFVAATAIFGEETTFQLARVIGAATAKMAEAVNSAYRAAIVPEAVARDTSGLALVEANLALDQLLPVFLVAVRQLIRRHIVSSIRPVGSAVPATYDSDTLAVAFVDLVGSTALAAQVPIAELSALLSEFEATASDIVVGNGGRVVKLIGDEIMFTSPDPATACNAADEMVAAFHEHPSLPPVRAGAAYGEVLTRDGDCFGPVVNLAARLAGHAGPGQIIIDRALADTADTGRWRIDPIGTQALKGFAQPVVLLALRRQD